jgi:hypothetical protein
MVGARLHTCRRSSPSVVTAGRAVRQELMQCGRVGVGVRATHAVGFATCAPGFHLSRVRPQTALQSCKWSSSRLPESRTYVPSPRWRRGYTTLAPPHFCSLVLLCWFECAYIGLSRQTCVAMMMKCIASQAHCPVRLRRHIHHHPRIYNLPSGRGSLQSQAYVLYIPTWTRRRRTATVAIDLRATPAAGGRPELLASPSAPVPKSGWWHAARPDQEPRVRDRQLFRWPRRPRSAHLGSTARRRTSCSLPRRTSCYALLASASA